MSVSFVQNITLVPYTCGYQQDQEKTRYDLSKNCNAIKDSNGFYPFFCISDVHVCINSSDFSITILSTFGIITPFHPF